MRYLHGPNRVYRIDDKGGAAFYYVAPDATAAVVLHQRNCDDPTPVDALKVEELPAEKQIRVSFDAYPDAIAMMVGLPDVDRHRIKKIIQKRLRGSGRIEAVSVSQAAEQWARSVPDGQARQLTSLAAL